MSLDQYVDVFSRLRCGQVGAHLRPHKPVLLLSILDMFEGGAQRQNEFHLELLLDSFRQYFEIVRSSDDQCNPVLPYFHLRGDKFWHHRPNPGKEAAYEALSTAPTVGRLLEIVAHAYVDNELFELCCIPEHREQLRQTLITTYFADHREALNSLIGKNRDTSVYEAFLRSQVDEGGSPEPESDEPTRSAAFSKVVRETYDYRCAACGLRVLVAGGMAIVDAAHIVPFSVTHDNDPRNGIALCKNHHWAMDRNLLAPGPDLKWHVSKHLDDRIEGQSDLVDLKRRTIILPRKKLYYPKSKSLEWRMAQLESA